MNEGTRLVEGEILGAAIPQHRHIGDDNPIMRQGVAQTIEKTYRFSTALEGEAALGLFDLRYLLCLIALLSWRQTVQGRHQLCKRFTCISYNRQGDRIVAPDLGGINFDLDQR